MAFAPVASGDLIQAETINNIVNGAVWFSSDSGTANSYSVTFDGVTGDNKHKITGLTAGLLISFKASASNTGASSLAVVGPSGVVATPNITKSDGSPLSAGDIVANQMVTVIYNAAQSRFEMVSSSNQGASQGPPLRIPAGGPGITPGEFEIRAPDTDMQYNSPTGGHSFQTNGTEVASIDNLGQFRGKSIAGGWSLTQSVLMTANAWATVTNLSNITINPATTAFMPNMATGQIVIPMTGNYRVSYSLDLRYGSSGPRWAAFFVNGISPFLVGKGWIDIALDTSQIVNIANSGMTFLYAGSTVELRAYHNGPNDLYAYNAYSQMTIEYLGGY